MIRITLLLVALFSLTVAPSQESKSVSQIEKTVEAIENIVNNGNNIGQYVHRLFSDDGGDVFLKHRYFIDTSKRVLHKAVYEFINFEQIIFYYYNQQVIKAIITDTSINTNQYKCEYYFDNNLIYSTMEQGIPNPKNIWNKRAITLQAELYLKEFSSICEMLDRQK